MAYVIMGECPIIWYFIVIRPINAGSGELWTVCASIYEADVEPLGRIFLGGFGYILLS